MVSPITNPAVLAALEEMDNSGADVTLSTSVAEHLKQQAKKNGEKIDVVMDNPSIIPLALAAIEVATERGGATGSAPVIRFDIDTFIDAVTDSKLTVSTRLNVGNALALVPGFDERLEFSEYKTDPLFSANFIHATAMAKAYTENAMGEYRAKNAH